MRTIVLGGAGNFGARFIRALREDPAFDLVVAGRRLASAAGAEEVPSVVVDIHAPDLAQQLRALSADLVIHCVGPFQGQDYAVAKAVAELCVGLSELESIEVMIAPGQRAPRGRAAAATTAFYTAGHQGG